MIMMSKPEKLDISCRGRFFKDRYQKNCKFNFYCNSENKDLIYIDCATLYFYI